MTKYQFAGFQSNSAAVDKSCNFCTFPVEMGQFFDKSGIILSSLLWVQISRHPCLPLEALSYIDTMCKIPFVNTTFQVEIQSN